MNPQQTGGELFVLVQKRLFHTPKLDLDIGETIPATVGYETYGQLSPARDNAILICHHITGTSHAAGRYHPDDAAPGWWDPLIGPGKAFDTDRFYIVSVDSLCNLNVRNPLVITTGPATINPATGRPYGADFPQVTIRDNVRLQQQLLHSLGIEQIYAVAGPCMGGFQALEWAVTHPHMVQRVIAVASAHQSPPVFALSVCQAGYDAVTQDPDYRDGDYYGTEGPLLGLTRAVALLNTLSRSDAWAGIMWGRKTAKASMHPWADREGRYAFQAESEEAAALSAQDYDANHFLSTARACLLHDVGYGNRGMDVAAQKIRAQVLLLPVASDLLFPPAASEALADEIRLQGGRVDVTVIDSPNGHLAAISECSRFEEAISRFLVRGELH